MDVSTVQKPQVFWGRSCNAPLQYTHRVSGSDNLIWYCHTRQVRFHYSIIYLGICNHCIISKIVINPNLSYLYKYWVPPIHWALPSNPTGFNKTFTLQVIRTYYFFCQKSNFMILEASDISPLAYTQGNSSGSFLGYFYLELTVNGNHTNLSVTRNKAIWP